jgi:outer membrane protein insertion porin family
VNRRIRAAVLRFAALGGLLVVPALVGAQLRCTNEADREIRKVAFAGNAHFSSDELSDHVVSTPTDPTRRVLRFIGTRRCLQSGLLAADALRLKSFYIDQGFPDARVDTVTSTEGKWVDILFRIQEGNPVLVDSFAIAGIDAAVLGKGLTEVLKIKKGARYSAALLDQDIDTVEARLRNNGYPLAAALRDVLPDSQRVAVTLNIVPGPRARIGKITINSGGPENKPSALAPHVPRDILRFSEGDLYRERALYESERQFYRVGNFLSAAVTPVTDHVATDSLVDVNVIALEDLMKQFEINPGFGTLDCLRARIAYTDKAFLHGLNRIDLSAQASKLGWANRWPVVHDICNVDAFHLHDDQVSSSKINYNTSVRLTRPITLHGGLLPSFSAYSEQRGAFNAYLRTTKIGGAATVSKSFPAGLLAQSSYNIEYGHTDAADAVLCFLFRACDETTRQQLTKTDKRLAVLGLSGSRDMRNNPDSTTHGTVVRTDLRTAGTLLGSDKTLSFNKGVLDGSWYGRSVASGVVALRLRGGLIGGGAGTVGGARLPPPQERLYAGGENSVRGFGQNELGPQIFVTDDTLGLGEDSTKSGTLAAFQHLRKRVIPTGGNTMVVANFEYRLRGPFLPTLQTILFADMGKLWSRELADEAGQGVKWTPGVALRYFSPLGPIQVNVGYNKYPRPDGPVFFDGGVDPTTGKAPLLCLSGVEPDGRCRATNAWRTPNTFLKRLTLSIAFPPDF